MLSKFVLERVLADYVKMAQAVKLVRLMEHLHVDQLVDLTPSDFTNILIDNPSVFRLSLVKKAIKCAPAAHEPVLPILKHLLDNPDISVRRLAVECISSMTSMDSSSPLPARHRHLFL